MQFALLLLSGVLLSTGHGVFSSTTMHTAEPNPPVWGDSVHIIRETDCMETVRAFLKETEDGWNEEHQTWTSEHHFSNRRHALLFAPGTYTNLTWQVGYYVHVAGLGVSPNDVEFRDCGPHVPALNHHVKEGGTCLDMFWRSAENIFVSGVNMTWAVSQAAPLRRVHVAKDLFLFDGQAFASGGHLANAQIDGVLRFGSQQQWMSRNVHLRQGIQGGAWSLVFAGCTGQVPEFSPGSDSTPSITVKEYLPIRIEKPYVAVQKDSLQEDELKFDLRVPSAVRGEGVTTGTVFDGAKDDVRDFSRVHVVIAGTEDISGRVQAALDAGKDVVLAPGIHQLTKTLEIRHANQVILGLGLATMVAPTDGSPCVRVAPKIPGVRIAFVMLEASTRAECTEGSPKFSSLLEWGDADVDDAGDPGNPGAMFDVFCRVGGATAGNRSDIFVDAMMRIHSGNVVGDNLWLWRADHGKLNEDGEVANYPHISPLYHQTEESEFRVQTGIEVGGNDVTIYGLAVEHANGHQTVWSGQRGAVYFYQCELPYDVKQASFGDKDYNGYLITENVQSHTLAGAGVYSNFRNEQVKVKTAIRHPKTDIQCVNPFTVFLDNNGYIETIVNGVGNVALQQGKPVRLG